MTKRTVYGRYLGDVAACEDPVMERGRGDGGRARQDRVGDEALSGCPVKGGRSRTAGGGVEVRRSRQAIKKGPRIVLEGHDFNKR